MHKIIQRLFLCPTPAKPKTILADFTLEFRSKRFRAPMEAVSEESSSSRPSDCEEFVDIVGTHGGWEGMVRCKACEAKAEPR